MMMIMDFYTYSKNNKKRADLTEV